MVHKFGTNKTIETGKMFKPEDFENIDKDDDAIPDGVIDASNYFEILVKITDYLEGVDYEDNSSRMGSMMNIVNLMHEDEETLSEDEVYGVCISLMYHLQTMLSGMVDEDRKEYFEHIRKEVLPIFEKEASILPYYESDLGGQNEETPKE